MAQGAGADRVAGQPLESDLRSGLLVRMMMKWPVAFRFGARFSERRSATVGTRSLDLFPVAAAKTLRAVEFVSFDA